MTRFIPVLIVVALIAGLVAAFGVSADVFSSDDAMRLFFFVLLCASLGGGFFAGGKANIRQDLRALLFWLVALAGVTALYGLRHDLKAFGLRAASLVVPGMAVTRDKELVITRDRSGMFTLDGTINGVELRMLFDTGASGLSIAAADAERIGLKPHDSEFTIRTRTANGIAMVAPVRIKEIRFGPITLTDLRATVSRPGALSSTLLGHEVLNRLAAYEVRGDQLILRGW